MQIFGFNLAAFNASKMRKQAGRLLKCSLIMPHLSRAYRLFPATLLQVLGWAWVSATPALQAQTDPGPVDAYDRESARAWFNTWWPRTYGEPLGFTGDPTRGVNGDISPAARNQMHLRINLYRRMAGLEAVGIDAFGNTAAQAAAVLNAANDDVTHTPPTTWKFYTQLGAQGSLGSQLTGYAGPEGIFDLIADGGPNNAATGHRGTLLEPQLTAVGIGASEPIPRSSLTSAGILAVYTSSLFSRIPRTTPEPLVVWPRGYVPYFLIPGRWSAVIPDTFFDGVLDLREVQVSVTRNGVALPIGVVRLNAGSGVVFTLDGTSEGVGGYSRFFHLSEDLWGPPMQIRDSRHKVRLSNIKVRSTGGLFNGTGLYEYEVVGYNPFLGVILPGKSADLINISTRSIAGLGSSTQIAGFIVGGASPRRVLIRAGGPWLEQFGVPGALPDPVLTLFENGTAIQTNEDWETNAALVREATRAAGAPAFAPASKDAALVTTLTPGKSYTAHVTGKGVSSGNAIVEVYDLDGRGSSQLINISTRSFVGTGASIQIGGFILRGTGPRKVLIRAGGPWLQQFGVGNILPDPVLTIYRGGTQIASNDDWSSHAEEVASAGSVTGASPFSPGSKDAAIVLTLDPEVPYTAQVSGKGEATGNAIIEVYAVP